MTRPCAICAAPHAALGLRLPGLRSELLPEWRGYRWACSPGCLAALEERRAAFMVRVGQSHAPAEIPAQGVLL